MTNSTEQHRRECEARWVLKRFGDKAERQKHYQRVALKRGKAATDYMIEEVKRQYENQQNKRHKRWLADKAKKPQALNQCQQILS